MNWLSKLAQRGDADAALLTLRAERKDTFDRRQNCVFLVLLARAGPLLISGRVTMFLVYTELQQLTFKMFGSLTVF